MKWMAAALIVCWTAACGIAGDAEWMTDLTKAQAKAKEEKKLVFLEFTGSDWCPPCIQLKKNVLSSPEFEAFAKDNLVLVEIDFPRRKQQDADVKKSNEKLSQKYKVEGFPTVVVMDSAGKELKRDVGFGGESAKDYVAKLKKLRK